jgi:hypothetical protein
VSSAADQAPARAAREAWWRRRRSATCTASASSAASSDRCVSRTNRETSTRSTASAASSDRPDPATLVSAPVSKRVSREEPPHRGGPRRLVEIRDRKTSRRRTEVHWNRRPHLVVQLSRGWGWRPWSLPRIEARHRGGQRLAPGTLTAWVAVRDDPLCVPPRHRSRQNPSTSPSAATAEARRWHRDPRSRRRETPLAHPTMPSVGWSRHSVPTTVGRACEGVTNVPRPSRRAMRGNYWHAAGSTDGPSAVCAVHRFETGSSRTQAPASVCRRIAAAPAGRDWPSIKGSGGRISRPAVAAALMRRSGRISTGTSHPARQQRPVCRHP